MFKTKDRSPVDGSATRRHIAAPLAAGCVVAGATSFAISAVRVAWITESDQPAYHVLTHLPVAVFGMTMAAAALIARRAASSRSAGRANLTFVAAVLGWFGLAQGVEALGALAGASRRTPGAEGNPVHVTGLVMTAATAVVIAGGLAGLVMAAFRRRVESDADNRPHVLLTTSIIGLVAGTAWGVVARVWMRVISTSPEFSWSGTLMIIGSAAVAGAVLGVVYAVRRTRSGIVSGLFRVVGVLALLPIDSGPGLVLLPTGLFAALAVSRRTWPTFVRFAFAIAALLPILTLRTSVVHGGPLQTITASLLYVVLGVAFVGAWTVIVAPRSRPGANTFQQHTQGATTCPPTTASESRSPSPASRQAGSSRPA